MNKEELFEKAKKEIVSNALIFIRDVADYLGVSAATLYKYFPTNSPEREEIDTLINKNKVELRVAIRKKFYQMENPTTLIALYKIVATEEEREALASTTQKAKQEAKVEDKLTVHMERYKEQIISMLKDSNRYSETLDPMIAAMASSWSTLEAVNVEIQKLQSPFIIEKTTQSEKIVIHPFFSMRDKCITAISKYAKLLGMDFENAPETAQESPLIELTNKLIKIADSTTKAKRQ